MKIVGIIVIFYAARSIQACGTTIKTMRVKRGDEIDWEKWPFPPYNDDWWGFVNLLGTREVPEFATTKDMVVTANYEDDPGWPKQWKSLGIGNPGSAPPKWSHMTHDVGQPPICLMAPNKGKGNGWFLRWYFDSHRGKCRRFVYTGSGGNVNKFLTERGCKKTCVETPKLPCVPDRLFNYASFLNIHRRFIATILDHIRLNRT